MKRIGSRTAAGVAAALLVATTALSLPTRASDTSDAVIADINETLGSVPDMFLLVPESARAGAWNELKMLQLNPDTELSGKEKELIGLAVAAQIPCEYCVYFHTEAARLNGATEGEIREAIAMAAITRHWSTVLNGTGVDYDTFVMQADAVFDHVRQSMTQEEKH